MEEKFFAERRRVRLARKMRWRPREATGALAHLWHESQSLGKTHGSAEDILEWCEEDDWADEVSQPGHHPLIEALILCEYIAYDEEMAAFYICGNRDQIASIQKFQARAAKGGEATKRKHRESQDGVGLKPSLSQAVSPKKTEAQARPQAGAQYNSMQGNAIQGNAIQGNSISPPGVNSTSKPAPGNEPPVAFPPSGSDPSGPQTGLVVSQPKKPKAATPKRAAKSSRVWAAYAEAYQGRTGQEPVRNAKVNSQACQLVDLLGEENAIAVVQFYCRHPNSFYMSKCYDLGLCVVDAQKLFTEMRNGGHITPETARRASLDEQNQSVVDRVLERRRQRVAQ